MLLQKLKSNNCLLKLASTNLYNSESIQLSFNNKNNRSIKTWSSILFSKIKANEDYGSAKSNKNMLIEKGLREEKKSKAMQAYLERAQKYNEFMKKETEEYHNGKRHLANMMGVDLQTFTQEDVDAAIDYLFPSGLFVPAARPFMKPPEKVFPPKKDAEFDDSGRPYHHLFYTGKPNFYQLLHDFGQRLVDMNNYEDKMIRKGLQPDPNINIVLSGSVWIKKQDLQIKLVEEITDKEYTNFISLLERVVSHPYVYNIKEDVMSMRTPLMDVKMDFSKPPPANYDKTGRAFITTEACPRKKARAKVTVWYPGTGKIDINGRDITYFDHTQPREQILYPLHLSGMLNKVDIEATVTEGGPSGQAGAIRWGISWGLRSFVDAETLEKMRLAGLLTKDFRRKERKKFGQWGARRKYTWKKR